MAESHFEIRFVCNADPTATVAQVNELLTTGDWSVFSVQCGRSSKGQTRHLLVVLIRIKE